MFLLYTPLKKSAKEARELFDISDVATACASKNIREIAEAKCIKNCRTINTDLCTN